MFGCTFPFLDWNHTGGLSLVGSSFIGSPFHLGRIMKIHVGYDLIYDCVAPTPMVFMLNVHPSRAADLLTSDRMRVTPSRAITTYTDGFGNKCVFCGTSFCRTASCNSRMCCRRGLSHRH